MRERGLLVITLVAGAGVGFFWPTHRPQAPAAANSAIEVTLDRSSVASDQPVRASVQVRNVGSRAGDEVVQLYTHALEPKQVRALKELRGFERITLKPDETRRVEFTITFHEHDHDEFQ